MRIYKLLSVILLCVLHLNLFIPYAAAESWQAGQAATIRLAVRNPSGLQGAYLVAFDIINPDGKKKLEVGKGYGDSIADTYIEVDPSNGEYKWTASVNGQVIATGNYFCKWNNKELVLTLGNVTSGWIASQEIAFRVGLRNKYGIKGDTRKVDMVICGPDREYRTTSTIDGNNYKMFTFPIEFGELESAGDYTWEAYQNGNLTMSGNFRINSINAKFDQITVYQRVRSGG